MRTRVTEFEGYPYCWRRNLSNARSECESVAFECRRRAGLDRPAWYAIPAAGPNGADIDNSGTDRMGRQDVELLASHQLAGVHRQLIS